MYTKYQIFLYRALLVFALLLVQGSLSEIVPELPLNTTRFFACSDNATVLDLPNCTNQSQVIFVKVYNINNNVYQSASFQTLQNLTESDTSDPYCVSTVGSSDSCLRRLSNLTYSGTDLYCSNYNCTSQLYDCYCYLFDLSEMALPLDDNFNPINSVPVQQAEVVQVSIEDTFPTLFIDNPGRTYSFFNDQPLAKRSVQQPIDISTGLSPNSDTVTLTLGDTNLVVKFSTDVTRSIVVQKGTWRTLVEIADANIITIAIPTAALQESGFVEVIVFSEGLITYTGTTAVTGYMYCRLSDCIICSDALQNFNCLSSFYKGIIITTFIVLILCGFALFGTCAGWIFYLVAYLIRAPYYFAKNIASSRMVKAGWKKAKRAGSYMKPKSKSDQENPKSKPVFEAKAPKKTTSASQRKSGTKLLGCIALVCCAIPVDARCDYTFTQPMNVTDCLVSGSTTTCKTQLNLLMLFQYQGQTLCFQLFDPVTGTGQYEVRIQYTSALDYMFPSTQYYTSPWAVSQQYIFRCAHTTHCSADLCGSMDPILNRNAYGELTSINVVGYPGRSSCTSVSPYFGQCGTLDPACGFYGYGINPTSTAYEVANLVGRSQNYTLSYEIIDLTNKTNLARNTVLIGRGRPLTQTYGTSGLTFTVGFAAAFLPSLPPVDTSKIMITPQAVYHGPASNANSPKVGTIGDIQSSSPTQLLSRSTNAFIFDPMILSSFSATSTKYTSVFEKSAAAFPNNFMKLQPVKIGAYSYSFKGGLWQSVVGDNVPLQVAITTNNVFSFKRITYNVCPVASFVNATGCYNCTSGATVFVKMRSTCLEGLVTISTDSATQVSLTQSAAITVADELYPISVYTAAASNDFTLIFTANGGVARVNVKFTAVSDVDIVSNVPNATTGNDTYTGPNDNSAITDFFTKTIPQFFEDVINGVASWWEYLIFVIILVAAIAGSVVGIIVIVKIYRSCRRDSYKKVQ